MDVHNRIELNVRGAPCLCYTFDDPGNADHEDFLLVFGDALAQESPIVRVHSQCLTGEALGSFHCDCGDQLLEFVKIAALESGILVYLFQEGRGIGLKAKLDAYKLQANGLDTFEANRALGFPEDAREYKHVALMLRAVGVRAIKLHTNNPEKAEQLRQAGLDIVDIINTGTFINPINARYLRAKYAHGQRGLKL
jgi:GTP cyclohydrolase II